MKKQTFVIGAVLAALLWIPTAFAQTTSSTVSAERLGPSTDFEITEEGVLKNAYAGLGVGLGLPGLVAFQANMATFGGIAPGFYLDFRVTGTVAGREAFGSGSPMWRNSGELDLRVGYGSRNIDNNRGVIRDGARRKIHARIPSAFGVTPYLGWRGRWGYNVQQIRLGIHVESETDVEVRFTDGRMGQAFKHWAFDFELSYSGGWQKGLGGQIGYDHWINEFIFLRTELGFAAANKKKFYDEDKGYGPNPFTGTTHVNPAEGFWTKLMLGFAFRFRIPDFTEQDEEMLRGTIDVRTHEDRISPDDTRAKESALAHEGQLNKGEKVVEDDDNNARTRGNTCQRNADCDDGIFCNGEERCIAGVCQPGKLPDDGVECTQLVCDEQAREFRFEPMNGLCGDGIFCNGTEICDVELGCIAGEPVPVEDGNPCTKNYCDENLRRVVTEPIPDCYIVDEDE